MTPGAWVVARSVVARSTGASYSLLSVTASRCEPTTLFDGELAVRQLPKGEYRTNVDAVLLARFAAEGKKARRGARTYDLGAGVGAVGLSLMHLGAIGDATFVEIDAAAAALAAQNAAENGWEARIEVLCDNVANVAKSRAGDAALVVCNPPYYVPGSGRTPIAAGRRAARFGEVELFVDAAARLLGRNGRACFVYPARDLERIFTAFRDASLEPKRLQLVHGRKDAPARVALIEAMVGKRGGLVVMPPA